MISNITEDVDTRLNEFLKNENSKMVSDINTLCIFGSLKLPLKLKFTNALKIRSEPVLLEIYIFEDNKEDCTP